MKYQFKGEPMSHQRPAIAKAWPKKEFAFFHEMGTGKTYTATHLATFRYFSDQIDAVIVICPTPLKFVWEEQVPMWTPNRDSVSVPMVPDVHAYESPAKLVKWYKDLTKKPSSIKWLIVGVEALSQGSAYQAAFEFAKRHRCMCIVDESDTIKNSKAVRTKNAGNIGAKCDYRLIMTGTPVTQGLEDLFGQFTFLHPDIVGCRRSITLFRNRYCIMGGFEGRKILGYQNEEELMDRLAPYIDIVKKKDVMDLPDKVYETIYVSPTKEQMKVIEQLQDTFMAEDQGKTLSASTILERLTRYQQVIGGHFPFRDDEGVYRADPISGNNPKIEALIDNLKRLPNDAKVIIWARFIPELERISLELERSFGAESVVQFHGGVSGEQRAQNVTEFQTGKARFFVSNQATGGAGITLTAATFVYYYSNSFSYRDRIQSEDRAHRRGQVNKVTYVDLTMDIRYDKMILAALNKKQGVAEYVEHELENRK